MEYWLPSVRAAHMVVSVCRPPLFKSVKRSPCAPAENVFAHSTRTTTKGLFGYVLLKFNFHHINVFSNAWSTKCRLIACMSIQIRSNLRDESIKPN
jgi:hypothetical protein